MQSTSKARLLQLNHRHTKHNNLQPSRRTPSHKRVILFRKGF